MNANSNEVSKSQAFRFAKTPLVSALRKAFASTFQSPPRRTLEALSSDNKIRFESLEPRILMSADLVPGNPTQIPADGSMIHALSVASEFTDSSADTLTLNLDANQRFSVIVQPETFSMITTEVAFLGGNGAVPASNTASGLGQPVLLQNVNITNAGNYSLTFQSTAGTGSYHADVLLNTQIENEQFFNVSNDNLNSAENINDSSLLLPNGAERLAVVGRTDAVDPLNAQGLSAPDFYSFTLSQGQGTDIVLTRTSAVGNGDLALALFDQSGQLLALSDGGKQNVDAQIHEFVAPTTGTYYARVVGTANTDYSLLVTRGSAFELTAPTSESIANSGKALGGLGGGGGAINVAVVSSGAGYDQGLQATVNQLNDDTYFDFNATLVAPLAADTLAELSAYDAVVIGGPRYSYGENGFATYASALRAYAEAGGGVVTTGWAIFSAQNLSGQARTDFDAVVPVNVSGSYDAYIFDSLFTPVGTHPILDGVSSFYTGTYTQYPTGTPQIDAGATLLGSTSGYVAAAAAEIGSGRSVYLGPVYAWDYSGYGAGLRSGEADQLLEQSVAWAAQGGVDQWDDYSFQANAGDNLVIITATSGDGLLGLPDNTLDALLELYAPSDALNPVISNNNGAPDGHNAQIAFTALEAGTYRVRVKSVSGAGAYTLSVQGTTASVATPPSVVASSLTSQVTVNVAPNSIDFIFSEALDLSSVQASDLVLSGPAINEVAKGVQVLSSNTLRFDITGLTGMDGIYTISLFGINNLTGVGMAAAYSQDFTLDTTGPFIVNITPSASAVPGDVAIEFTFDEGLDSGWFGSSAIRLHEQLSNQDFYASNASYDNVDRRASFSFNALPEGNYQVLLSSYYLRDVVGNTLLGGDYTGTLIIDNSLGLAYPTPLLAEQPLGSRIYDAQASAAFYGAGDWDDYSIQLDGGQTLSVGLFPVDASFRSRIKVFDPNGNSLGYFEAGSTGQLAVLNTLPVSDAGLYRIRVTNLEGDGGRYQLKLMLNATVEQESIFGWVTNDNRASAQDINASFIQVEDSWRGAVHGQLPPRDIELANENFQVGISGNWNLFTDYGNGGVYANWDNSRNSTVLELYSSAYGDNSEVSNSAELTVDLSNPNLANVHLQFWMAANDRASSIMGDNDGDGLWISTDGVNWTPVLDFASDYSGAYQHYDINISQAAASAGFDLTSDFRIRFQQYGAANSGDQWRRIDDLRLSAQDTSVVHEDWYSFTLSANELASLVMVPEDAGVFGEARLALFDENGIPLALGSADASNTAQAIRDFWTADDGNTHTYYARVADAPGDYNLVITRNAAFEREINDTTPQGISQTGRVQGYLDGVINVAILDSYNNAYQLRDQLNDSQWDGNYTVNFPINAQQVQLSQISTLAQLNQFDVVFIGAYSTHSDLQTLAPLLRQWVEVGGGLIASAPITNQTGQDYGTPIADIEAIVPVNTSTQSFLICRIEDPIYQVCRLMRLTIGKEIHSASNGR